MTNPETLENNKFNPSIDGLELAKWCYRKFYMLDDRIGFDELGDRLVDFICNQIDADGYEIWLNKTRAEIDDGHHG